MHIPCLFKLKTGLFMVYDMAFYLKIKISYWQSASSTDAKRVKINRIKANAD